MHMRYDIFDRNEPSRIYLAKPDRTILCALNGIDAESVDFTGKAGNDISTISFDLHRYVEKGDSLIISNGYELVSKFMRLYVTGIGWFIMDAPETQHNGSVEYKTVHASSAQKEFNQIPLDQWKVNRGTTDSLEMLVEGNVTEIDGVEFANKNITFCNPSEPELSLVHILVSKAPGWSIGYVDENPKDGTLLCEEIGTFDVNYSDCYSFMTGEFSKYFNCIVDFDYLNYVVNFYRVENYGRDTSITIGFRNVENSNSISIDDDNIFTKFRVSGGDDLGIEQVNGGSSYLLFLSDYWLTEKHLSRQTINKYKDWFSFCQGARKEYAKYSRQWAKLQDEISELYNRLPVSDCDPENWSDISDEALLLLQSDYEAERLGYEKIYSDEDGNFDPALLEASEDAPRYHQITDTILPNIQIELDNRRLPSSAGAEDYLEDYLTNWSYYGIYELEARLHSYLDIVNVLRKSHYDLSWEEYSALSAQDTDAYPVLTREGFEERRRQYKENAAQLDAADESSCAFALNARRAEASVKEELQTQLNESRSALAESMRLESRLTDKEQAEISHLINQTTYTNENIFITSRDSSLDTVDMQQKLCETALEDIAVYSEPQATYTTSLDNLLTLTGSELHAKDLDYGNFIRLGLRDDYYVKLRVTEMSFNPLLHDNQLTLRFSNMIKVGRQRNDFVSLLDSSGNLSNKSASTSYSQSGKITDDNVYQLLQKILESSRFNSKVEDIINTCPGIGDSLKAGDIYGNNGFFEYIQSELISAGQIVAGSAEFKALSSLTAAIDNLLAGNISAELSHVIRLTAQNVNIDEAVVRNLIASQITVDMLKAGDISADRFHIVSDDGGLEIAGNTMQFRDENDVVRIQIGRDADGSFSFVLYDETGQGVLIDSAGIKESAISDGLIQNDMIADGSLAKEKLNFPIVETDENGKVSITQILDPDGGSLGVSYKEMQNSVEQLGRQLDSAVLYNVIMGREFQSIPCIGGIVKESFLIEIPFSAYKGTEPVGASASVGILPAGITLAGNTSSTTSNPGTITLNVSKDASLGGDAALTGQIDITFHVEEQIIRKQFGWTKVNDGASGASFYTLELSSQLIKKSEDGFTPAQITLSSYSRTGTDRLPYDGRFLIAESEDGIQFTTVYSSAQDENSYVYTLPSNDNIQAVKFTLCHAGSITRELDSKTAAVLTDSEYLQSQLTQIGRTITELSSTVDKNTKEISLKASQTDITAAIDNYDGSTVKTMRDQMAEHTVSIGKITSQVSDVTAELGTSVTTLRSEIQQTAGEIAAQVSTLEGDVSTITQTVSQIEQRVQNSEGDISNLEQDAEGFRVSIENTEKGYSEMLQTVGTIQSTISDIDGNMSSVTSKAEALETRLETAAGNIAVIEATADSLSSTITDLNENLGSKFEQTEKGFTAMIQSLQEGLSDTVYKYFDFDEKGITISSGNSNITLRLDDTGITFYNGETRVAYINSNKLHIDDATIVENMQIGNFGYTKMSNGGLTFGKISDSTT